MSIWPDNVKTLLAITCFCEAPTPFCTAPNEIKLSTETCSKSLVAIQQQANQTIKSTYITVEEQSTTTNYSSSWSLLLYLALYFSVTRMPNHNFRLFTSSTIYVFPIWFLSRPTRFAIHSFFSFSLKKYKNKSQTSFVILSYNFFFTLLPLYLIN